ncbi:hypothetical protein [Cellulophaga tyrosinoxydans]|uniref:hypothetical protein n=1 Tax=Cellulophaga tyrosinoxydans TaxID=504486 RepID=UPI00190ECDD3|nr:hypothetical protein [Cellulophaga tyrosinoxydans]
MIQQVWLNLPVKDIEKAKIFFRAIGFKENPMHKNAKYLGSFFIGTAKGYNTPRLALN